MKKRALVIIGIIIGALVLLGLYLLYLNVFVNKHRLDLVHKTVISSEYRTIAADSNIMPSYMWRRIQNILMDGDYLMSDYMLEGRLANQDAVPSDRFELKDQSWLLLRYLASGDRGNSVKLVGKINEDFRNGDGSYRACITKDGEADESYTNSDEHTFLEAYIEYYSAYGNDEDLENIRALVSVVFDDTGLIKPELLKSTTFTNEVGEDEETYEFRGVKLSDINLELIGNLERNGFIAEGSYDRYCSVVSGGVVSYDVPYYAYACVIDDSGEADYIYSGMEAATISVGDSVKTMVNLARVDLLSDSIYHQFKTNLINDGVIYSSYSLTTGLTGGSELQDSYVDALALAKFKDDTDLFRSIAKILSVRVATKTQSRALYLVFRSENNRYVFYSDENIRIYLVVNGMFAV